MANPWFSEREKEKKKKKSSRTARITFKEMGGEKLNHGGKPSYEEKTNVESYWPKGRG